MGWKVYLNYFLWKLKIRKVLPSDIIKNIKIEENNEELINISSIDRIIFSQNLLPEDKFLRKTVAEKLIQATKVLPKNTCFKIYEAYRSLDKQKELWNNEIKKLDNLNISEEEKKLIVQKKIANPFSKNVGGHQTGAAIDITLCDENGNDYNMGTNYLEFNDKTKSFSKEIDNKTKKNRKLLFSILKKSGFNNYPLEWWHFSYGDQMWAAYKSRKKCFYGVVK